MVLGKTQDKNNLLFEAYVEHKLKKHISYNCRV